MWHYSLMNKLILNSTLFVSALVASAALPAQERATLLEHADAPVPGDRTLDAVSLAPYFDDPSRPPCTTRRKGRTSAQGTVR